MKKAPPSTTKAATPYMPAFIPSFMPVRCCSTCGRTCMWATCLCSCLCLENVSVQPYHLPHWVKQGMSVAYMGCMPRLHAQERCSPLAHAHLHAFSFSFLLGRALMPVAVAIPHALLHSVVRLHKAELLLQYSYMEYMPMEFCLICDLCLEGTFTADAWTQFASEICCVMA